MLRVIYPKNCPNETRGYWLITPNQQIICIETNIAAGNYKSASGQLQNNSVNGAILITIHHVIMKTSSYEVIATRLDKFSVMYIHVLVFYIILFFNVIPY